MNNFFIASVQAVIRHELNERQWTYRELASRVDVSEVSIKRWMTGADLSLQRVARIASALQLTPFQLLERAEQGAEPSY